MATSEQPPVPPPSYGAAEQPSVPAPARSRRERALLGPLPDDFLRVAEAHTAVPTREQPHLAPLTYAPQAYYRPVENTLGRLKVTVAQAKLNKNYGFTRMDPYCRVRIGHSVYETPTDYNGSKNPRWNKVFSCNLPRGVNSMFVEMFNERYLAVDDRIAWTYFEFPDDLFSGETVEEWVALSGKQGEGQEGNLNIILSFSPAPPITSYQLSAYGGQPVSVVPQSMPAAQVYYHGGYPPSYPAGYPQQPVPQSERGGTTQGPVLSRPRVRDEDVKQLQEMFPTVDTEVIRSVLEASNGQVDSAVTNLLQMIAT